MKASRDRDYIRFGICAIALAPPHLGLAQSQYRDRVSKAIPFGKCASKCRRACGTFE